MPLKIDKSLPRTSHNFRLSQEAGALLEELAALHKANTRMVVEALILTHAPGNIAEMKRKKT